LSQRPPNYLRFLMSALVLLLASARVFAVNPDTCLAAKQANPGAQDGDYTLYVGGDGNKPWLAYCKGMATTTPTEYLTLTQPGSNASAKVNYSEANHTPPGLGRDIFTYFSKIRVLPGTLQVDITDQSFSSINNNVPPSSPKQPYANAGGCRAADAKATGNVDLRGTPFTVGQNQFITDGWNPHGTWAYNSHDQVVNLMGYGYCGGTHPIDPTKLQLVYNPTITGMQIIEGGNIGVGTDKPASDLDVDGGAHVNGNLIVGGSIQGQSTNLRQAAIINGYDSRDVPVQFYLENYIPDENKPPTIRIHNLTKDAVKTFVIDHPMDPDRYLVHATLEGPESAVYYRGNATLVNGRAEICLPTYFEALTRSEGRTIQLTNVDGFDRLAVQSQRGQKILNGVFLVVSNNASSTQAFDWVVTAVRADVPLLEVEPTRKGTAVSGFGPYTFVVNPHPANTTIH